MLDGIDISAYQVETPPLDGLAFVFVRASYGVSGDIRYDQHAANVRAAGKALGAYHFWYDGHTAAEQASAFLSRAHGADLFVLDYEGGATDTAGARAFIDAVQLTGRKCGLYHSASGYPTTWGQDFRWIAKWSTTPPSIPWDFWQYRGSPLDFDHFNGSQDELERLIGGSAMGLRLTLPPTPVAGAASIVAGTDTIRVADGSHYRIPVTASRPAYAVALASPLSGPGYLVDLDGDEAHFVRVGPGVTFVPATTPADPAIDLLPGVYRVT